MFQKTDRSRQLTDRHGPVTHLPPFGRRSFIGLTAGAITALLIPGSAGARGIAQSAGVARAMPASWPSATKWSSLAAQVGNRLIKPKQPWAQLETGPIPKRFFNPWFLEELPGATQSTGMFKLGSRRRVVMPSWFVKSQTSSRV